jgi:hypothetical protein
MSDLRETAMEMMEAAELELFPEELEFLTTSSNRWPEAWAQSTSILYSSKLLARALEKHAAALMQSTEAVKEHSTKLARTIWVLIGATIVLTFFTFVLVISTLVSPLLR